MQGGTIKSVIIFILLAIFAFIAGSFVTDGLSEALIPTVMIVGAFGLIALGKNSWWLLVLFPPIFSVLPVYLVRAYPIAYGCAGLILLYWLYMSSGGITRFIWRSVRWLDIATFLIFAYTLYTWVLNPVTFNFLVSYTDEGNIAYGADVYLWCVGALVFYIAVSVIPMDFKVVVKLLKWSFILCFCVGCVVIIKQLIFPSELQMSAIEEVDNIGEGARIRNPAFASTGMIILKFFIAKYSMIGVLVSPLKLAFALFGCVLFLFSGHRLYVIHSFCFILCISVFYRQVIFIAFLTILAWGGLVMFSQLHVLERLPYSFQRSIASVPGVTVSKTAEFGADASLLFRYKLWENAFDNRKGLIKDYVWGDGYKMYMSKLKRTEYLLSMNKLKNPEIRVAENGNWHAGWLNVIYRVGFVGLVLVSFWFSIALVFVFRVCKIVQFLDGKEYIYMQLLSFPGIVLIFYWGDGTWGQLFGEVIYIVSIVKLSYVYARDEGMMKPMFQRKSYVPLMVEANESQSKLRVLQ